MADGEAAGQGAARWDAVNAELARNGFAPVRAKPVPTDVRERCPGMTLLGGAATVALQHTLCELLEQWNRRGALTQDLLLRVAHLEAGTVQPRAEAHSLAAHIAELEQALTVEERRAADAEELRRTQERTTSELQRAALLREQELESTIERLGVRLRAAEKAKKAAEDAQQAATDLTAAREKRLEAQFEALQKRKVRARSSIDRQLLDLMELYDSRMEATHSELEALRQACLASNAVVHVQQV